MYHSSILVTPAYHRANLRFKDSAWAYKPSYSARVTTVFLVNQSVPGEFLEAWLFQEGFSG